MSETQTFDVESRAVVPFEGRRELATINEERSVSDLVQRHRKIQDAIREVMVEGVDYGNIPGVKNPSLFKPGAEKLCQLFMLVPEIEYDETYHDDGHYTVVARCFLRHVPSDNRMGPQPGLCTTRETKYAYRKAEPVCPDCGAEAVLKSKDRDEYFCWRKRGGCGHTFQPGTPGYQQIASQPAGEVANTKLADSYNTVLRMAAKRALVAATLSVTGASEVFTQDVEDLVEPIEVEKPAASRRTKKLNPERLERLNTLLHELSWDERWLPDNVLKSASRAFGHEIERMADLTPDELETIINGAEKALADGPRVIGAEDEAS